MRSAGLRRARLVGLAVACAVGLVPTAGSAPGPLRPPVAAHAVSVASSPVSYAYDPAGRLSAVTTDAGSATYAYDPVGNILSIARLAPGTVAVFQFYPRAGSTGTAVTISGAGFDPVPANDTVRFNGTPAAVESASSTSLVVTVPAGANTGPISVQTGGQTATSSAPFTVHGDLAPAITSVAPTQIVPGDPVTITGSNFSGDRTLDDVSLDGTELRVLSANATTVTATLPDAHRPIFSDPNKSVYNMHWELEASQDNLTWVDPNPPNTRGPWKPDLDIDPGMGRPGTRHGRDACWSHDERRRRLRGGAGLGSQLPRALRPVRRRELHRAERTDRSPCHGPVRGSAGAADLRSRR